MQTVSEVQDWLTQVYGFPVPELFARFVQTVSTFMEEGYENPYDYLGWELSPAQCLGSKKTGSTGHKIAKRYPLTPIELFSFGWSGADGEHYGYLIHAPELNQTDNPIVEYGPMNDFGMNLIGKDTQSGLEGLLSLVLEFEYAKALHKHNELSAILGLYPSMEKASWYQNYRTFAPLVPEDWRYEPSSDKVGVLAPAEKFSPEHDIAIAQLNYRQKPHHILPQEILETAQNFLSEGYPATALAIIRECYWQRSDADNYSQYAPLWQQAYIDLDRQLLADTVDDLIHDSNRQTIDQGMNLLRSSRIDIALFNRDKTE